MNALFSTPPNPLKSAADVLKIIEEAELPPIDKRDMASAVKCVCELLGCSPASLTLDLPALRGRLAKIRPAAHGISNKTLSNRRSLFGRALELAGVVQPLGRGAAKRHPSWAPLVAGVAHSKRLVSGLAAFTNWCAQNAIEPADVDDGALARFSDWLEHSTLHARPHDIVRDIPKMWQEAARLVPGWPTRELARISFRVPSQNLHWNELPASLRGDAEAYLRMRGDPDPFDIDDTMPTRPLAASTIKLQQNHIRLSAAVLMHAGVPPAELMSLADLLEVERFKVVLRHYHGKAKGKPNAFVVGLAGTLIDIARYHLKVSDAQLSELRRLARRLPPVPFDLTDKNKELLQQLSLEQVRVRLLFLPERLMSDVKAAMAGGRVPIAKAQVAVAVAILLLAPVRAQNLARLNWSRHFKEPAGPHGKLPLYIPKDETKTARRDLSFTLPPETAAVVRWYRHHVLPRLGADPNGDLFVTTKGKRKSQETLAQQITEIIEAEVGVHMTPHQFRHLVARLYLEAHPEDIQTVTDLLGHSWSKTTSIYAGLTTERASRAYAEIVEAERAKLAPKRPRRGK